MPFVRRWINNDLETLAKTIHKVLNLSESEIAEMDRNGKQLVEEKYSDIQVTNMMKQLYEWILNGGEKPEFVYE